ncbi:ClpX C4-type zinc finger protein [Nocardioides bruguierae]|uniref:ClpX C4-type zinc finger protein n=1 Tax=Nocardioides bruguierae TaxID=2945102 RepID=A0A9X2D8A9_9ACTN|nr:ClpX C4-type zinc finger protein [Nocardioides bruguierae]MCL8025450.1 ClpX C4-type zinc finger protein [Nocardioides bruguierae]MCM0620627.1 ClpX C4-type zinc finger protein [Nocardioides bruguierae]
MNSAPENDGETYAAVEQTTTGKICSFCGRGATADRPLAGGYGAMICRACIDGARDMLDDQASPPAGGELRSYWEDGTDGDVLAGLRIMKASARQADEFLFTWVAIARAHGNSWAAIGDVFGTTRQAAWERFARRLPDVTDLLAGEGSSTD